MQQEPFDPLEMERLARQVPWIDRVVALPSTQSTNDDAAALARDGAAEGTVVVADVQTAGRGRLGRAWIAPAGVALHASWIVRWNGRPEMRPLLGLATGVAAAAGIEQETGVDITLKWPNDLLAPSGRKVGGILAEALPDGAVVIGLGVNVRQDSFPDELTGIATSLLMERSRPIGRARLLGAILNAFTPFSPAPAAALEEYRHRCATLGRRVRVDRGGDPLDGVAVRIADDGALIVEANGIEQTVTAGDVVHVRPLPG